MRMPSDEINDLSLHLLGPRQEVERVRCAKQMVAIVESKGSTDCLTLSKDMKRL